MKKLSILLLSIFCLGLVSCDDSFTDPTPQHNEQEPLMSMDGLSVAKGASLVDHVVLSTAGDSLELITTTATPTLTGKQTIQYMACVSGTEDFAKEVEIEVPNGKMAVNDLNSIFRELLGKTNKEKTLHFRFAAYLADGTSRVRFGTKNTYFNQANMGVTPLPEESNIEEAYYLLGDMTGWDSSAAVKFDHSTLDVNDDPTFTIVVKTTKANSYWKIAPQSAINLGADLFKGTIWGTAVNGDPATSGSLVKVDPQAGMIPEIGKYRITINMLDNTYSIDKVSETLYLVGQPNGWDINGASCKLVSPNGDGIFKGTFALTYGANNNFRFYTALGNWDENSIGSQEADSPVDISSLFVNSIYEGKVVKGKGSFHIDNDGVYLMTVNLNEMTIRIEPAGEPTYIYMVGNINGWTVDASAANAKAGALASLADNGIYTATLDLPDSGNGKSYFRFYKTLDGNWDNTTIGTDTGGDEEIEFDGNDGMATIVPGKQGSFFVPVGKYKVTVDLNENILSISKVTTATKAKRHK